MPWKFNPFTGTFDFYESSSSASLLLTAQAEPADGEVANGTTYPWMSNGTGYGNAGDICVKIHSGGVIKTATLVPFSLIT